MWGVAVGMVGLEVGYFQNEENLISELIQVSVMMTKRTRATAEECFRLNVIEGMHQVDIAVEINKSQARVSQLISLLEEEWFAEYSVEQFRIKIQQTRVYEHIIREAMDAWERSKEDAETKKTSTKGKYPGDEEISVGQVGNPAYLKTAMDAMADIRKIWGLDAPQVHELGAPGGAALIPFYDQSILEDPTAMDLLCLLEERLSDGEDKQTDKATGDNASGSSPSGNGHKVEESAPS